MSVWTSSDALGMNAGILRGVLDLGKRMWLIFQGSGTIPTTGPIIPHSDRGHRRTASNQDWVLLPSFDNCSKTCVSDQECLQIVKLHDLLCPVRPEAREYNWPRVDLGMNSFPLHDFGHRWDRHESYRLKATSAMCIILTCVWQGH